MIQQSLTLTTKFINHVINLVVGVALNRDGEESDLYTTDKKEKPKIATEAAVLERLY